PHTTPAPGEVARLTKRMQRAESYTLAKCLAKSPARTQVTQISDLLDGINVKRVARSRLASNGASLHVWVFFKLKVLQASVAHCPQRRTLVMRAAPFSRQGYFSGRFFCGDLLTGMSVHVKGANYGFPFEQVTN